MVRARRGSRQGGRGGPRRERGRGRRVRRGGGRVRGRRQRGRRRRGHAGPRAPASTSAPASAATHCTAWRRRQVERTASHLKIIPC